MEHLIWSSLSNEEIAKLDLAERAFRISEGLPCPIKLDLSTCRNKLDEWVEYIRWKTELSMRTERFRHPYETDATYRMLVLVSLVLRDLGVRYNQNVMKGEFDARDSCSMLLHGILTGRGGSCFTMPLLYTAIGRRLGYPLYLRHANGHTYYRWEDANESFNIEGTCWGFGPEPDEYFLTIGERPLSWKDVERGYFRNLSPREEVAALLMQRGHCLLDHLRFEDALIALYTAHQLHPVFPPIHILYSVSLLLFRVFGEKELSINNVRAENIDFQRESLLDEFPPYVIRDAKAQLARISNNWNARSAFPRPDLRVPGVDCPSIEYAKDANYV